MSEIASLEMLLRYLIVALPLLVLLVLFFLLYSGHRAPREEQASKPGSPPHGEEPIAVFGQPPPAVPQPVAAAAANGACVDAQEADVNAALLALEQRLAGAEEEGEPIALAHIYLALGRARITADEEPSGLDALRSAAGLANLHKQHRVHAEARLELAEAAFRHGDLTSACEHWQMARMAFLDEGARADGDKIDRRMRANGCPTDWVLTDF